MLENNFNFFCTYLNLHPIDTLCVTQFYVYVSTLYSYKIFYIVHVIVDI